MRLNARERGSAMLIALVITILVVGLGGAFLAETVFRGTHQNRMIRADEAQAICDSALDLVRLTIRDWRNRDPLPGTSLNPRDYAWNKIFLYCGQHDLTKPNDLGIVTSDADALKANFMALYKTNSKFIEQTWTTANPGAIVPSVPSSLYLTDAVLGQVFCTWRPYGKGAYWVQMKNNQDVHGDGNDNDGDGDPWNFEPPRPPTPTDPVGYAGDPPSPLLPDATRDTTASPGVISGTHSNLIDGDRQCELVITACMPDGTVRQIEVLVEFPVSKFIPGAALLDAGTINMQGDFQVKGSKGLVHANEDINGNGGNNASIAVSADASGTNTLKLQNMPPGGINSGAALASIPTIDNVYDLLTSKELSSYMANNQVRLIDAKGNVTDAYGKSAGLASNFGFSVTSGTLSLGKGAVTPFIYFFDGNVKINGGGGPYTFSMIASGSITTTGSASYTAYVDPNNPKNQSNTLFIAGGDLDFGGVSGNAGAINYSGVSVAVEQVKVHGTFTMNGSIIGENLRDVHNEVTSSSQTGDARVIGTPQITYNGLGTFIPTPALSVAVRNIRRLK